MVSKIAVMAIVGIVAVPILLGFALNFQDVTETRYAPDGDSLNVTPILQNGAQYTFTHGDSYALNSKFELNDQQKKVLPVFETTTTNTSMPLEKNVYTSDYPTWNGVSGLPFGTWNKIYFQANPGTNTGYVTAYYGYEGNTLISTIDRIFTIYYDSSETIAYYSYFTDDTFTEVSTYTLGVGNASRYTIGLSYTNYNGEVYIESQTSNTNTFVNLSAGYHFDYMVGGIYNASYRIVLPDQTHNFVFTMDLDSITQSDYSIEFETIGFPYRLTKTTIDGQVSWQWAKYDGTDPVTLYYDPSKTSNTYQVYTSIDKTGLDGSGNIVYSIETEMRYVGNWPIAIGPAAYYQSYSKEFTTRTPVERTISAITFYSDEPVSRTPTVRIDDAYFRAFQYPIIEDQTYTPSDFKTNPTTTIKDVMRFGSSFEFGGNTYTIDAGGNITMGTHKVSAAKLTLESIPVASGYENRINGNTVSVTAEPSQIVFNGQWSASITTVGNAASTYNKSEWVPGQFAWNGIDDDFLMVGLMTCLGAFVGLSIYGRRSGAKVLPLLLVCGGAALMFLLMV